jgi:hypothetical protein
MHCIISTAGQYRHPHSTADHEALQQIYAAQVDHAAQSTGNRDKIQPSKTKSTIGVC